MLERDGELAVLDAALAAKGELVVVRGPAGIGKSALIRAVRSRADGFRILHASGAEFEREFAFGIVQQLLGRVMRAGKPPAGAAAVFDPVATPEPSHATLNALYWLCAELAESQPLLLTVDDVHWADEPSLRFLEFLSRRLEQEPIVMIAGERPGGATLEPLAARTLTLAPLSAAAVEELLREQGMQPSQTFLDACVQTTGGNPMLITELGRALSGLTGTDADAEAARTAVPGSLARSVTARLHREGEDAVRVAHAVAVLGDGTRVDRVAKLAGTTEPIDGLIRAGIFAADHLGFVHPMIREAVVAELLPARCAALHRDAAELLRADGERDEAIALHLLHAEPAGDPEAARVLRRAGERAAAEGAPMLARTLLTRALQEPPASQERPAVLLALGTAELSTGEMRDALEHLGAVVDAGDPVLRAHAELARANLLNVTDREAEAAAGLRAAIDALGDRDPALTVRLMEQLVAAQQYVPALVPARVALLEALDPAVAPRPLLAHVAFHRAVTHRSPAEVVAAVRRAYADGELFEDFNWGRSGPHWISIALAIVEAEDDLRDFLRAATRAAARSGSPFSLAYVAMCRSIAEWRFGDLRRAEEEARRCLEVFLPTGVGRAIEYCTGAVAQARLDQGDVDGADALLADVVRGGPWLTGLHAIRGRVRLAQNRPEEALEALERQFTLEREHGWQLTPWEHSRATYVQALAALGRTDEGIAFAEQQLAFDPPPGAAAMLLFARSRCELDALPTLQAAAEAADRAPTTLVAARVYTEFGAALRRGNRRSVARDVLKKARELAHGCGAEGLERQALQELQVAGARPQRVALSGVEALTASELRAAELAAQGLTNRQVAETLFVTRKTVEMHLRHTYAKLGIASRTELPDALVR